jgi:hypothetical protein
MANARVYLASIVLLLAVGTRVLKGDRSTGLNNRPIAYDIKDFVITSHSRRNASLLGKIATLVSMLEGMENDLCILEERYR